MVYPNSRICNAMDGIDYGDVMISKCIYCGIDRDKLYMGGGLYVYRCPKCGSEIEMKQ